jgi:hypothetical protein
MSETETRAQNADTDPPKRRSTQPLFDRTSTHQAIFYGLIGACAAVLLSDLFYHKHGHFEFESSFGFHAFFGFLAYLTIVNSAKLLRLWVRRSEDYYGR